jgi:hypothetical protein
MGSHGEDRQRRRREACRAGFSWIVHGGRNSWTNHRAADPQLRARRSGAAGTAIQYDRISQRLVFGRFAHLLLAASRSASVSRIGATSATYSFGHASPSNAQSNPAWLHRPINASSSSWSSFTSSGFGRSKSSRTARRKLSGLASASSGSREPRDAQRCQVHVADIQAAGPITDRPRFHEKVH